MSTEDVPPTVKPATRAELPVHPLVAGLASRLIAEDDLATAIANANAYAKTPHGTIRSLAKADTVATSDIDELGTQSRSPELITFAGYLGGRATPEAAGTDVWQILFTDATAGNWLVVAVKNIELHTRVADETAAYCLRDVIWVGADSPVGRGDTSSSVQGLFLRGALTRAGDLATSLRGDTFSRSGGLLLDALTPRCCGGNSRH
jgi:hypothetical protein